MDDKELVAKFRSLLHEAGVNVAEMDDRLLLSFICSRKNDLNRALNVFLSYVKMTRNHPDLMTNLRQSQLQRMFDSGHHLISPRPDRNGCRVMLFKIGHWNPEIFSMEDIFRGVVYCFQMLASERETQRKGIVCVTDFKGLTLYQARQVTPFLAKKMADLLNGVFPLRFHGIHIINEPWVFKIVLSMIWPFLSNKIRNRIFFHGNCMATLHKQVDPACLPSDYDGWLGPLDQMRFTNIFSEKNCPNMFEVFG